LERLIDQTYSIDLIKGWLITLNVEFAVSILYLALTTLAFYIIFRFANKLLLFALTQEDNFTSFIYNKFSLNKLSFIQKEIIQKVFHIVFKILKISTQAILLYFYFSAVFSYFPVTREWSLWLVQLFLGPITQIGSVIINYIPNIFYIFIILIITRFLIQFIRLFFFEIKKERIKFNNFYPDWAIPTFNIIRFLIYAISLVMIFPYLPGSSSPAFQGLSVFLGVLVSFGSGSSIANIISGVMITYMRPFKVGDRVKISDSVGDIVEKSFLVTRLKTIKNVEVTIPNSQVLGGQIINYSTAAENEGLILNTTITIGYDTPWPLVQKLMIEAAMRTDKIDLDKKPFVLQTALNDFYVAYEINAYTKFANSMASIYSDLHKNIQTVFSENKVEIMSPHYTSYRKGGADTTPPIEDITTHLIK
jgi:small-conductance mechanosensitive channel